MYWRTYPVVRTDLGKSSLLHRFRAVLSLGLLWYLRWWRIFLQCRRPGFDPWVGKIPWISKWQPTPVFLSGEFQGQRSLAGYSPWSCKRVRHNWVTDTFFLLFKQLHTQTCRRQIHAQEQSSGACQGPNTSKKCQLWPFQGTTKAGRRQTFQEELERKWWEERWVCCLMEDGWVWTLEIFFTLKSWDKSLKVTYLLISHVQNGENTMYISALLWN